MSDKNQKSNELPSEEVKDLIQREFFTSSLAVLTPNSSYEIAKDIGNLQGQLKETRKENAQLQAKLEALQKEKIQLSQDILSLKDAQQKLKNDLEGKNEKLRAEMEEKTCKVNSENEKLKGNFENLKNEFEKVKAENEELKKKVGLMKNENQQLRTNMEKIQNEQNDLVGMKERLVLGQVSWLLEEEMWKYVLPDEEMGSTAIFSNMTGWLEDNSQNDAGVAALERWDKLKKELNWNDIKHKRALKNLKKQRIRDAHPISVDLGEARRLVNERNYVADFMKMSCLEIIGMIEKARFLNQ